MAESRAAKIAANFSGDPKGLPAHVQEAIADVIAVSESLGKRVALAEKLYERDPDHELALGPDHGQSTQAYRFEEIDGEIIEIRKNSSRSKVQILHRPDLTPPDEVDPASALTAALSAPEPVEE